MNDTDQIKDELRKLSIADLREIMNYWENKRTENIYGDSSSL